MTPVAPPPPGLQATVAAAPTPLNLTPGTVVDALVLANIDDVTLKLLLSTGTLDLKTDMPLPPGTSVELAVEGTAAEPKIILRVLPELPGQPALPGAPRAPATASTSVATPTALSDAPAVEVVLTSAVLLAGNAAVRQDGVAPQGSVASKTSVTTQGSVAPQANVPQPSALPTPAEPAASTPGVEAVVKSAAALVGNATARQGGLAPLYADLVSALVRPDLPIPQPVVAAARQLLSMRLDAGGGASQSAVDIEAADIKSALLRSGLVAADTIVSNAVRPAAASDLRSTLLTLRDALQDWADAAPLLPKDATPQPPVRGEPQTTPRAATPAPLPPFRNVPTLAQAPALPTLPADAAPADIARHLIDETDAAMARQTLLQIASLPDEPGGLSARDSTSRHLTFDIPLATPQGTAVAQFRIERDPAKRGGGGAQPVWQVSFSIDLEPMGPVHARIGLVGDRASVTLKAERRESVDELARGLPLLEAGLRNAELEPGRLLCHTGPPAAPAAEAGRLLDHVS